MIPVLAFTPEEAARIVAGEQTVVTYPADLRLTEQLLTPLVVGQTVAIARQKSYESVWNDDQEYFVEHEGAIVGSARVEAVVPIDNDCRCPVCGGTNTYDTPADCRGCNGGLPDGWSLDFTPGRWAVILTDAAPCEERCPACGRHALDGKGPNDCQVCCFSSAPGSYPIPCEVTGPIMEVTL